MLAVALALVVVALFSAIQIEQHMFRQRAERLLADALALTPEKSSFDDMQPFMGRWSRSESDGGSCNAEQCDYSVDVDDAIRKVAVFGTARVGPWAERGMSPVVAFFHAKMPIMQVEVREDHGFVRRVSASVETYVPKGYGPPWRGGGSPPDGYVPYSSGEYELIARVTQLPRGPVTSFRDLPNPHPTYQVYAPSACTICIALETEYTTEALPEDKERMSAINMACLTQWAPCTTERDMMPKAWEEYAAERGRREDSVVTTP